MRWLGLFLVAGLLGLSPVLRAQGEVKGTEVGEAEYEETVGESKIAKIHSVERGLFAEIDFGPYYQIPIGLAQEMCFPCVGSQVGIRVGYDVLNNIVVSGFLRGSNANFTIDYATPFSGDLASYYTGVGARFSYLTLDRLHATVGGGVGIAFLQPAKSISSQSDASVEWAPSFDVEVGVEYYTLLRHFSVGLELGTTGYIIPALFGGSTPLSLGFWLQPTVKYTF